MNAQAQRPALTGLVLAGGASTRMRTDKAVVTVEGRTLVERVVAALDTICDEVIIASGDGQRLAWLGRREVADEPGDAGPLAGMLAGFCVAATTLVAVVAVDHPDPDPELLVQLSQSWDGLAGAVVPTAGGRPQPLHAVWSRSSAAALAALLASGQCAVGTAVEAVGAQILEPHDAGNATLPLWARDLDDPDDLAARTDA